MLKSRVYSIKQRLLMERLVQKVHSAGFKGPRSRIIVCMGRDEDDRDSPVSRNYLTLELEPVHVRHSHIKNQAGCIVHSIRIQKRLRRSETLRSKSDRSDQIVERIPEGIIIVYNRNERNLGHPAGISSR
jgi:hypothetical protein